ncbi:asparaginyl-tRNA synthetase [Tilletia horrida]|nr:asparaginyl-tRNA synthetase [Tilletia horrida]
MGRYMPMLGAVRTQLGGSSLPTARLRARCCCAQQRQVATSSDASALPITLRALLDTQEGAVDISKPQHVHAWVRSVRSHRKVSFLTLTDGTLSGDEVLQAVVPTEMLSTSAPEKTGGGKLGAKNSDGSTSNVTPGAAVKLLGELVPSKGAGQKMELKVSALDVLGSCEAATYPLATPQQLTQETLRRLAHLRVRTSKFAAILRSRHSLLRGLESWFDDQDFLRVTTPIMTSSDCEGAGEVFQVVADSDVSQPHTVAGIGKPEAGQEPTLRDSSSFFSGSPSFLTVSSQLHLEAITALSHPRTYTIAPAFRAERSATSRHLSEFWMCEAEVAWLDVQEASGRKALEQTMMVCEQSVRSALRTALGNASSGTISSTRGGDLEYLHKLDGANSETDDGPVASLRHFASPDTTPWPRITYAEAIQLLKSQHKSSSSGFFSIEPVYGDGLASEHEKWLASGDGLWKQRQDSAKAKHGGPVFVTNFPAAVKAFYMRANPKFPGEEAETVACFDLLVPRVGELAGGSVREERERILEERMRKMGLSSEVDETSQSSSQTSASPTDEGDASVPTQGLEWYTRDLRRYGGAPHGGFGIGIERLVSWVTGVESVKDCIPFPRTTGAVRF